MDQVKISIYSEVIFFGFRTVRLNGILMAIVSSAVHVKLLGMTLLGAVLAVSGCAVGNAGRDAKSQDADREIVNLGGKKNNDVVREQVRGLDSADLPDVGIEPNRDGSAFDGPDATPELKMGTATLAQVKDWAIARLTMSWLKNTPVLEMEDIDVNLDGVDDLMISDDKHPLDGTGGCNYLVFEKTSKGYRFVGQWFFGGIRPLPKDHAGRQAILLSSPLGSGLEVVTFNIMEGNELREVGRVMIRAGDSGTDEGNRAFDALFAAPTVSAETIRQIFAIQWD